MERRALNPSEPLDVDALAALAADPASPLDFGALAGRPALLAAADGDAVPEAVRLWLRGLACPVIAIGSAPGALASACDVHVASLDEAAPLLRQIQQAPIAAATLVQVLRAVEQLPLHEALLIESLAYSTLQAGPEYRRWLAGYARAEAPSAADEGPAVLLVREQATLRLELNRPSQRNAMTVEMRDALIEALQLALSDRGIQRIEIRGRGRCFSTGGELDEFGSAPDPASAHLVRSLALPGRLLAACAERATVHVHGACIGSGIEFPAFASRLLSTTDTHFQLPELRYGLIPGAGGCMSVSRRIGRQRAAWMVLSGKRINAETALRWGLVDALE